MRVPFIALFFPVLSLSGSLYQAKAVDFAAPDTLSPSVNQQSSQTEKALGAAGTVASPVVQKPACGQWVKNHCDELWSLQNRGNYLGVKLGQDPNQEDWRKLNFLRFTLEAEKKLPEGFRNSLDSRKYFSRLRSWFSRREKKIFNAEEAFRESQEIINIRDVWEEAKEEWMFRAMEARVPGFYLNVDPTMEQARIFKLLREDFTLQIDDAIWSDRPEFEEAKRIFDQIRAGAIVAIGKMDAFESSRREKWIKRIREVRLGLPSEYYRLTGKRACAEDLSNAFNFIYENKIFLCGGLFGTEDVVLTLAHELAHVITNFVDGGYHIKDHPLFRKLIDKTISRCAQEPVRATGDPEWERIRREIQSLKMPETERYTARENAALSCFLQRKPKKLDPVRLQNGLEIAVGNSIDELVYDQEFSHRVNPLYTSKYGTESRNVDYLKGCDAYWRTSPPTFVLRPDVSLGIFLEEYLYLKQKRKLSDPDAFKAALESIPGLYQRIRKFTVLAGGSYSAEALAFSQGFGEDISENLADAFAVQFLREYLEKVPLEERRLLFLRSISFACDKITKDDAHSKIAHLENEISSDSHGLGFKRLQTFMTPRMADLLQCEPDPQQASCEAKFYRTGPFRGQ